MAKERFLQRAINTAEMIAAVRRDLADLDATWNARLYGVGLINELSDADAARIGTTANDIAALINFAVQFNNLMTGKATVPGDYQTIINRLRPDL